MFIHEVLVVPAYGHSGHDGEWDRGPCRGQYAAIDLVDTYVASMVEELENEGIRVRVLPTRTHPGIKVSERWQHVEPNSLVLHCLIGQAKESDRTKSNFTEIRYGGGGAALALAEELCDAIGLWGHCQVFGHKTGNPRYDDKTSLLNVPETKALAIYPFWLNGPKVGEYVIRLETLGMIIARCLADHLSTRGQAQRDVPPSLLR